MSHPLPRKPPDGSRPDFPCACRSFRCKPHFKCPMSVTPYCEHYKLCGVGLVIHAIKHHIGSDNDPLHFKCPKCPFQATRMTDIINHGLHSCSLFNKMMVMFMLLMNFSLPENHLQQVKNYVDMAVENYSTEILKKVADGPQSPEPDLLQQFPTKRTVSEQDVQEYTDSEDYPVSDLNSPPLPDQNGQKECDWMPEDIRCQPEVARSAEVNKAKQSTFYNNQMNQEMIIHKSPSTTFYSPSSIGSDLWGKSQEFENTHAAFFEGAKRKHNIIDVPPPTIDTVKSEESGQDKMSLNEQSSLAGPVSSAAIGKMFSLTKNRRMSLPIPIIEDRPPKKKFSDSTGYEPTSAYPSHVERRSQMKGEFPMPKYHNTPLQQNSEQKKKDTLYLNLEPKKMPNLIHGPCHPTPEEEKEVPVVTLDTVLFDMPKNRQIKTAAIFCKEKEEPLEKASDLRKNKGSFLCDLFKKEMEERERKIAEKKFNKKMNKHRNNEVREKSKKAKSLKNSKFGSRSPSPCLSKRRSHSRSKTTKKETKKRHMRSPSPNPITKRAEKTSKTSGSDYSFVPQNFQKFTSNNWKSVEKRPIVDEYGDPVEFKPLLKKATSPLLHETEEARNLTQTLFAKFQPVEESTQLNNRHQIFPHGIIDFSQVGQEFTNSLFPAGYGEF